MNKFKKKKLADIDRIINSASVFTKVLIEEGVILGSKWHTVDFYACKRGKGFYIEELRISSTKRPLRELNDFRYPHYEQI